MYRACSAISRKRPPPKNPRRIPEKWLLGSGVVLLLAVLRGFVFSQEFSGRGGGHAPKCAAQEQRRPALAFELASAGLIHTLSLLEGRKCGNKLQQPHSEESQRWAKFKKEKRETEHHGCCWNHATPHASSCKPRKKERLAKRAAEREAATA